MSQPQTSHLRLAGKGAIVTGAAYGIGAAIAERLRSEGAQVIATDVIDPPQPFADGDGPGSIVFERASVTEAADHARVVERCRSDFGSVDILVNNAALTIGGWLHEYSEEDWDRLFSVVVKGTFLGAKAVLPAMMEQGRGAIVNIASSVVFLAVPTSPAYGTAKAGVARLTRQIALDYGRWGVRCNAVCPGPTLTPKTRNSYFDDGDTLNPRGRWLLDTVPLRRFADPSEIANCVLFLASDEASYVSGVTLLADGGKSTHAGAMRPDELSPPPTA